MQRPKKVYPDLATACERFRFVPDEPPVLPRIMQHLALHSIKPQDGGFVWKFDEKPVGSVGWEQVAEGELLKDIERAHGFHRRRIQRGGAAGARAAHRQGTAQWARAHRHTVRLSSRPGGPAAGAGGGDARPADLGQLSRRRRYTARSAVATGSLAARIAGNKPPITPMTQAQMMPRATSAGVTARSKISWPPKPPPRVSTEWPLNSTHGDQRADRTADQRQQQRFDEHRDHHRHGAKTDGAQRGNFARTRAHRRVHGVERAEDRADRHDAADHIGDDLKDSC